MRSRIPPVQACRAAAAFLAVLLNASAALAADPPAKPGTISVLDEACVDRRTELCLRLADGVDATVLEATLQQRCATLACGRGWYKLEVVPYGGLGPLCVCERRSVAAPPGQRCAEGFKESVAPGPDGATRAFCGLPDMEKERYPGGWEWPATPFDLMTCLQFARFGPGSGLCRRPIPAAVK